MMQRFPCDGNPAVKRKEGAFRLAMNCEYTKRGYVRGGMQEVRRKIYMFGNVGVGNLGNECTLAVFISELRARIPDVELVCIGSDPEVVTCTHGVASLRSRDYVIRPWHSKNAAVRWLRKLVVGIPSEILRWAGSVKVMRDADALIIPGTGLLTDAYCLLGWGPIDLLRWSLAAKLCRRKLLFLSSGAGPIYTRIGRFSVRAALSMADFRSYRDIPSRKYLSGIGVAVESDRVFPDLVFGLRETVMPTSYDGSPGKREVIGIGVMEYAGRYSVEHPEERTVTNYLDTLARVVEWLLARDYDVRLLIGDQCDRPTVQQFRQLLEERLQGCDKGRILDDEATSVDALLAQIAGTKLVIATRFHNVVLALLCEKPVVAISFHHKVTSLMKAMDLSDYCLDIDGIDADSLMAKVCKAEENAPFLKATVRAQATRWRAELEVQYDELMKIIGYPQGVAAAHQPTDVVAGAGSQ